MDLPSVHHKYSPRLDHSSSPSYSLRHPVSSYPHGGTLPFHQKSTCLTQLTSEPCVVQSDHVTLKVSSRQNPRTPPCVRICPITTPHQLCPHLFAPTHYCVEPPPVPRENIGLQDEQPLPSASAETRAFAATSATAKARFS
jgi:hypothetical protein